MGYIYCIENLLNHKKYIGKTLFSVESRFKKHIIDSKRGDISHRPLYNAFHKYGIENFTVYTIEECLNQNLNDREKYWIHVLDTFNNGYNATLGGDGTQLYQIEESVLWEFFIQHKHPEDVAKYYNCSLDVIADYSKLYGINWRGHTQRHDIDCYFNNKYIGSFYSAGHAARWIIEEGISQAQVDSLRANIMRCCKGTRQTCCGFTWKFKTIPVV